MQLDNSVSFGHYENTPSLGEKALEIQFIEVASPYRRKGIATEVVLAVAEIQPDRTLVAFSEDADEFWASLGWSRYDHSEGARSYRPLFIAPGADS
ncbi:hypothetical protein G8767_22170 [Rhodococcus sp. IC4_135]|uniref:GNAT family N-acetyltransferase n=1 Tax=Rhodococcus sp. IC4_135 TaxID=2715537 RepID=UPI001420BAA5|nr:hypothetical protein [Rhodococcus sp. IC4_135]